MTILILGAIGRESKIAKDAADAALLNARAVINSERAWVVAKLLRQGENTSDYLLTVTNYGRTIGRLIEFGITYWCVPNDFRNLPSSGGDRVTNKSFKIILVPNENRSLSNFDIAECAGDSWEDIQAGNKTALFCWNIRYWDIVGQTAPHETQVYYSWSTYRTSLVHLPEHDIYT